MMTMCVDRTSGLCNRTRDPEWKGELRQGSPTRMRAISKLLFWASGSAGVGGGDVSNRGWLGAAAVLHA